MFMLGSRNTTKSLVLILSFLLMVAFVQVPGRAQNIEAPIVVLYDASHNPQFDADNEEEGLKLMLDMVNASTRYIVKVNEDPINDTILDGVDVLIVASPDRTQNFENDEFVSINEMLANGSSLLCLGDPMISQNSTYWSNQQFQDLGDNIAVNRFLDGLNMTGVRFSVNYTDDPDRIWSDTMFDLEHSVNATAAPYVIELDSTTWDTTHPIFKDINSLLLMTATLKPMESPSFIAHSYESSYAQYRRGPNTFANFSYPNMTLEDYEERPLSYSAINGTMPSWLSAFDYNGSRVIIGGSTIMFTGRPIDLVDTEIKWFYSADNARLFMNMIGWLSEGFVEPPSAVVPMAIISATVLVIGVVVYIFKKIRA